MPTMWNGKYTSIPETEEPVPVHELRSPDSAPLEPRKRTSYRTVWEYGGGDEESTNEKDAIL